MRYPFDLIEPGNTGGVRLESRKDLDMLVRRVAKASFGFLAMCSDDELMDLLAQRGWNWNVNYRPRRPDPRAEMGEDFE